MSGIATGVTVRDNLSPAFGAMTKSINLCLAAFSEMQAASGAAVNTASIDAARASLAQVNVCAANIENSIHEDEQAQKKFNNSMKNGVSAADGLGSKIKSFIGMYAGVQGIRAGIGFISDMIAADNESTEAQTKLATVMRQRMGANAAMIASVQNVTSAQQALGVIEDDSQAAGAQQLSTFLNSSTALNTLIPAMNNLAAQQKGVSASSGDLVNIGNLMGKVMQGQTSALTRVGITFDSAQEKVLKYGNEQERAAMLAEVITNNVGEMNAALAATPAGQIQQMKNGFGDVKETVGAGLQPSILKFFTTINHNMPQIQAAMVGLGNVLSTVIDTAATGIEWVANAGSWISDNWSVIEPIIGGIAIAYGLYTAAVVTNNTVQGVHAAIVGASAISESVHAAATMLSSGATFTATAAQYGFNAALLACPLTWIVIAVVGVVVALYAGVAAWNKFTGSSVSATGIIGGAIGVLVAFVYNKFVFMQNIFASVASFFLNVWNHPIYSAKKLFADFATTVIDMCMTIASAIDKVFGTSLSGNLAKVKGNIATWVGEMPSDYKEVAKMSMVNYDDAATTGYKIGQNIGSKVSDFFKGNNTAANGLDGSAMDAIADNTAATADNTGSTADAVDSSEDKLAYLKDFAEREIIDRTVFKSISVNMGGVENVVKNINDLDAIPQQLANVMLEQMQVSAEGVHK